MDQRISLVTSRQEPILTLAAGQDRAYAEARARDHTGGEHRHRVERRCRRGSQARALNMTIRTLAVVLCASGRRSARVGAGDSGGDRARGQFGADPGDTVQGMEASGPCR